MRLTRLFRSGSAGLRAHRGGLTGRDVGSDYDQDSLDLLRLGHRRELLAPVERPLPAATLTAKASTELGLSGGTTVTDGPYDLAACVAGAGVVNPGDGLLIVGTTLACRVPTKALAVRRANSPATRASSVADDADQAGLLLALPSGNWLQAMPAMVGTASLDWGPCCSDYDTTPWVTCSTPAMSAPVVSACCRTSRPLANAAPFVDPSARGQLLGLTVTTTAADVIRGVCEDSASLHASAWTPLGSPAGWWPVVAALGLRRGCSCSPVL